MSRQATRDTKPELELRRLLYASGLRYRVDHAPIAGLRRRADIVFARQRVAIFVDGCFWHSCPLHATQPTSNAAWWREKLDRNVARDRETDQLFRDAGWRVLRIWEHEDATTAAGKVRRTLDE